MNYTVKRELPSFAQLNLETGDKILISLTKKEIAIQKLGFLSFPSITLWKSERQSFIEKHNISNFDLINKIKELIGSEECNKLSDISIVMNT